MRATRSPPARTTCVMAVGGEKLKDSGYRKKYGVSEEQLKEVMTRIAWKNHHNGALNERAQFRSEVSKETIT